MTARRHAMFLWLIMMLAVLGQPAEARIWKGRRRRPPPPPSMDVQPSPAIEERVCQEISKAGDILADLGPDNLLDSAYLVSALYYHDGFLSSFTVDRPTADPERRIVAGIERLLTPPRRARYIRLLHEIWDQSEQPQASPLVFPVRAAVPRRSRRQHKDAIDLFAPEGAPVRSASRGMVVLADIGWSGGDFFSTSSRKGGNSIIIFDPDQDRFFRYCHLSAVGVETGGLVEAGQVIGHVGHSGFNASRPGHGGHLHFEVNQYDAGRMRALSNKELRSLLAAWSGHPVAAPVMAARTTGPLP